MNSVLFLLWFLKFVADYWSFMNHNKNKTRFINRNTFKMGTNWKTLKNTGQLFTTHPFSISNYHYCSLLFPSTSKNIYWIVCVNPKHDNLTWYEIQFTIFTYLFIEASRYYAYCRIPTHNKDITALQVTLIARFDRQQKTRSKSWICFWFS